MSDSDDDSWYKRDVDSFVVEKPKEPALQPENEAVRAIMQDPGKFNYFLIANFLR